MTNKTNAQLIADLLKGAQKCECGTCKLRKQAADALQAAQEENERLKSERDVWKSESRTANALLIEAKTKLAELEAAQAQSVPDVLSSALERMDRARNILTKGNPTPSNNWGMLDTSDLRAKHTAAPTPAGSQQAVQDDLLKRLSIHSEDKNNTAFSRSTMREVLQMLTAAPASHNDVRNQALEEAAIEAEIGFGSIGVMVAGSIRALKSPAPQNRLDAQSYALDELVRSFSPQKREG